MNIEEIIKEFDKNIMIREEHKELFRTALTKYKEGIKEGLPRKRRDDKTFDFIDSKINPRHNQGFLDGYNQALKKVRDYFDNI